MPKLLSSSASSAPNLQTFCFVWVVSGEKAQSIFVSQLIGKAQAQIATMQPTASLTASPTTSLTASLSASPPSASHTTKPTTTDTTSDPTPRTATDRKQPSSQSGGKQQQGTKAESHVARSGVRDWQHFVVVPLVAGGHWIVSEDTDKAQARKRAEKLDGAEVFTIRRGAGGASGFAGIGRKLNRSTFEALWKAHDASRAAAAVGEEEAATPVISSGDVWVAMAKGLVATSPAMLFIKGCQHTFFSPSFALSRLP
jgi:hypothetical protein